MIRFLYSVMTLFFLSASAMQSPDYMKEVPAFKKILSKCPYYVGPVLKKGSVGKLLHTYEFGYNHPDFYYEVNLYDQQDYLAKMLRTVRQIDLLEDKKEAYQDIKKDIASGVLNKESLWMLAHAGHYQAQCLIFADYIDNNDTQDTQNVKGVLAQAIDSLQMQVDQELIRIKKGKNQEYKSSYKAKKNNDNRLHLLAYNNLKSLVASDGLSGVKELIKKDPQSAINYIRMLVYLLPVGIQDISSLQERIIDECITFFEQFDFSTVNSRTQDAMRIAQFKTYSAKAHCLLHSDCQSAVNYYLKIANSDLCELDDQFKDFFASLYLYCQDKINREKIRDVYGVAVNWGASKKSIKWGNVPLWVYHKLAGYYAGKGPLELDQNNQEVFHWYKKIIDCHQSSLSSQDQEIVARAYTQLGDFYNPDKELNHNIQLAKSSTKIKKKNERVGADFKIEKDANSAINYYKMALKYGSIDCQKTLALLCFKHGVEHHFVKEFFVQNILRKTIHQDLSHWALGQMALRGQGQSIDTKEALEHFKAAMNYENSLGNMSKFMLISDPQLVKLIEVRARIAIKNGSCDDDSLYWCYLAGRLLDEDNAKKKEALELLCYAQAKGHHLSEWYLIHRRIDYAYGSERSIAKKIEKLVGLLRNPQVDELCRKCLNATKKQYQDERFLDLLAYDLIDLYDQTYESTDVPDKHTHFLSSLELSLDAKMRSYENIQYTKLDFYDGYKASELLDKAGIYRHIVEMAKRDDCWGAKMFLARMLVAKGDYWEAQKLLIEGTLGMSDLVVKRHWLEYLNKMCLMAAHKYDSQEFYDDQGTLKKDQRSLHEIFLLVCLCYEYTKDPFVGLYKVVFLITQSDKLAMLGLDSKDVNEIKTILNDAIHTAADEKAWAWGRYLALEGIVRLTDYYTHNKNFDEALTLLSEVTTIHLLQKTASQKIAFTKNSKKYLKDNNGELETLLECYSLYDAEKYHEAFELAYKLVQRYDRAVIFFLDKHIHDNHPHASHDIIYNILFKIIMDKRVSKKNSVSSYKQWLEDILQENFISIITNNMGPRNRVLKLIQLFGKDGAVWKIL